MRHHVVKSLYAASLLLSVCAVTFGAVVLVHGETVHQTVFFNLEEADARAHKAGRQAHALQGEVAEHETVIQATLEELDVTRRATEKLRRELVAQHVDWSRSYRQLNRRKSREVGHHDRLARMLKHAAPQAMAARIDDHRIVSVLDRGEDRIQQLVGAQSGLIVRLAQEKASQQAAKEEYSSTLKKAKKASSSTISRDLKVTDEKLAKSMSLILKNPSTKDFHRYKGTLIPPVKGQPSYTYGSRKQKDSASYVRHTGYTYMVDKGTEVRAVSSGLVSYAERFEGFGLLLIIDHGTGYHTIYAHLNDFKVKVGDRVSKGDTIALTGESGSLDGPKLYFELRKKGKPINPEDWFIRH